MSVTLGSISDLVRQARSGDTAAFGQIVRRYQALVSGVLFTTTGDFHQSEDLAQETFLIAWNKLGELENTENPAPWLCTIARNLVNRSLREKSVNTAAAPLDEEIASPDCQPPTELQRREQSELVWSAIGGLDEKSREALVLYYRSGKSVKEIADATGLTEESVRQRLVRARKSLKSKIERMVGGVLTETSPGDVFTYDVLAAITGTAALSMTQTAVAATTGAAAGSGAATGKTLGLATLWSIFGPMLFYVWIYFFLIGMEWALVRNAPTLHARRCRVYSFFWMCRYWVLGCLGLAVVCAVSMNMVPKLLLPFGVTVYPPIVLFGFFITVFPSAFLVFLRNSDCKRIKRMPF